MSESSSILQEASIGAAEEVKEDEKAQIID
jgi:hypothetical protein